MKRELIILKDRDNFYREEIFSNNTHVNAINRFIDNNDIVRDPSISLYATAQLANLDYVVIETTNYDAMITLPEKMNEDQKMYIGKVYEYFKSIEANIWINFTKIENGKLEFEEIYTYKFSEENDCVYKEIDNKIKKKLINL